MQFCMFVKVSKSATMSEFFACL